MPTPTQPWKANSPTTRNATSATPIWLNSPLRKAPAIRIETGEWKDGQTLFARCKVWDTTLGNNIMNTLRKGMDVVALADVKQNSWTDQQTGQKRSMVEFTVTNIGVGLRHATAQVMPIRNATADTTAATVPTPSRTMSRCSKIRTIRQCSKIRTIMVPTISSQPHPTTRGVLRWAIRHRCRRTTSRNSSLRTRGHAF